MSCMYSLYGLLSTFRSTISYLVFKPLIIVIVLQFDHKCCFGLLLGSESLLVSTGILETLGLVYFSTGLGTVISVHELRLHHPSITSDGSLALPISTSAFPVHPASPYILSSQSWYFSRPISSQM